MGSSSYHPDDEISPLSSPLGPLSESPDSDPFVGGPEAQTHESMKYSADTGLESLPRSPLLENEHGLGPSGLDRIRQQPSRVLTLPNLSTSSLVPIPQHFHSPSPRSASSSRAHSTHRPPKQDVGALEDLHRFPLESLHSFSFAQQSDELLHNRQNILKRSIDFMRDRFGWAGSTSGILDAQARVSGDSELQSMVDLLARSNVLSREERYGHADLTRGPLTGPASVDSDNVFDRAFTESQPRMLQDDESSTDYSISPTQSPNYHIASQKRGRRSIPSPRRVSLKPQSYSTTTDPYTSTGSITAGMGPPVPTLHTHSSKWNPVSQAVFRTESQAPWVILAANDLSCLVFGVTQAELRKLSILEVVQEDRREWLASKLRDPVTKAAAKVQSSVDKSRARPANPKSTGFGNGVTAQLLGKPSSRARRAQTDDGYGSSKRVPKQLNHPATKSRGVLLCGDVVPILKRNGTKGSASVWVMEKRGGLIWVIEEIEEDVAYVQCDHSWKVANARGDADRIWGRGTVEPGKPITDFLPQLTRECLDSAVDKGATRIPGMKQFAARTSAGFCVPTTVSNEGGSCLRVSSFPHVAGMMVLSSSTLKIISSNSVFSSALFGQERPEGLHINALIPGFDELLNVLTEEEKVPLVDGIVIPETSFRRARTLSILRDGKANVASVFLEPTGLAAKHRDGSTISVDVQLRVIKSGTFFPRQQHGGSGRASGSDSDYDELEAVTELVYALWVTYSRHIHSAGPTGSSKPSQPSPVRPPAVSHRSDLGPETSTPANPDAPPKTLERTSVETRVPLSTLTQQLNEAASEPLTDKPVQPVPEVKPGGAKESPQKKSIADYVILEEMGQGAYGEVKLARLKKNPGKKMVLKYVTKKRILVDTWTRDRRLGTVPLEIHVLNYLRREDLKHPNIVAMEGFFEDDVNYYIEMKPHGLPGMDLFDYIELKANMDESECRNIFKQVVDAIHHLHTKALVVHRDIKDENVILDGEGRIKLIDFGSAAYIKNGPFDVFVGTIDYAAPEVLQGKSYRGKEQDVWALGILLYTIVYKENPFYSVDEILDHPLRVPFLPFTEDCIDLVRKMLDRDVDNRLTITEVLEHPWMADS
ncbi:serine/threonine-protein kinase [Aspergillus candidus]|uniref:non-specific serine/threonine protein kinase n=1 Tax=Aspergillus candidus TaxID=41067 RepID=A0A2I2EXY3_ASPCN|nr:Pkinase-domain-containing protein [Aspergillus candidus]PLB33219.1 Pkinase-domain-containing protein [Aspergillus candidus]